MLLDIGSSRLGKVVKRGHLTDLVGYSAFGIHQQNSVHLWGGVCVCVCVNQQHFQYQINKH